MLIEAFIYVAAVCSQADACYVSPHENGNPKHFQLEVCKYDLNHSYEFVFFVPGDDILILTEHKPSCAVESEESMGDWVNQ